MRIGDVLRFSVIPLVLKDDRGPRVCLETCTPRRAAAAMEWILLADVEFAECQHGYYFVYKKIDHFAVGRWFADYEERNNSPESGEQRFRACL